MKAGNWYELVAWVLGEPGYHGYFLLGPLSTQHASSPVCLVCALGVWSPLTVSPRLPSWLTFVWVLPPTGWLTGQEVREQEEREVSAFFPAPFIPHPSLKRGGWEGAPLKAWLSLGCEPTSFLALPLQPCGGNRFPLSLVSGVSPSLLCFLNSAHTLISWFLH